MKILCTTPGLLPSRSVSSMTVSKTAEAFVFEGHAVTLCGKYGGENDIHKHYGLSADLEILAEPALSIPLLGTILQSRALAHRAIRERYDIIYSRGIWPLYFARGKDIDLIFEAHMPAGDPIHHFAFKKVFSTPNFRRLIVISNKLKDMYLHGYPVLKDKEIVLARLASEPFKEIEGSIQTWPGRREHPQIGYVGGLYEGRGVELICEIARMLPEMDFHLVGGGEKAYISNLRENHLFSNVFLHGFKKPAKLAAIYRRLDILLAPYQIDTKTINGKVPDYYSPTKIFEYMAAKKVIIASDLPIIREVLSEGDEFILAPPASADAWTKIIIELLRDDVLSGRLADAAYKRFLSEFTWTQRASNILKGL